MHRYLIQTQQIEGNQEIENYLTEHKYSSASAAILICVYPNEIPLAAFRIKKLKQLR